ncbi:MAG: VCBS repeat-containing protein [Chloracidobacterium sp.]|nr:VCBS repeat-containing protein [Chloracidobacterium sp.]
MFARCRQVIFIIVWIGTFCFSSSICIGKEGLNETVFTSGTSAVYTWHQTAIADWQLPSSWTPERTNPASDDILVFNASGLTTATNIPTQTIGQLTVSGNTTVNFQSSKVTVLTMIGANGLDLAVEQNSALNFNGSSAITLNLTIGATAVISGSMTFSSSGAVNHRLLALSEGSVTFGEGAVFTAEAGFAGNPFGTTNLNSVTFDSGSTYICISGSDPFGAPEPNSVVAFKEGSLFSLQGDIVPSFSGRSYANFEMNYSPGYIFVYGSSAWTVDNLTIKAGKLAPSLTGTPGHSIKGDITVMQGSRLEFQAPFPGVTINLNGPAHQTLSNFGVVAVIPGNTLAIDNPVGVTVTTGWIAWNLKLINGIVTIVNPEPMFQFRVPGTVTRVNGYIDGYLLRDVNLNEAFTFDVGTANGYSPITVDVTAGHDFPLGMAVKAVETAQPNMNDPTKALSRHWQVYGHPFIDSANITFSYLDPTDIPKTANESNFVIQRYRNGFTSPAGVIDTQANSYRLTGLNDFLPITDWTLAEPGAIGGTPTATATPTSTPTNTPAETATSTPTPTTTNTPLGRAAFDYDADGKTDNSVFRPSTGAWYLNQTQAGLYGTLFGFGSDRIVPADYDGDGKTDIAVYRPSTGIWYVFNSGSGTVEYHVFGLEEDLPTPADYDEDGKADISVFRPSTGTWYRQNSSDGSYTGIQFGASEDKPTVGDFDGDGKSDIAVFRPSTGAWYRINSGDGSIYGELFGFGTDVITPADYDGDGKTDLAAYRPTDGIWYLKYSSNSVYDYKVFGLANDIPAPGDFDGDGKADISVFRPSEGNWYRQNSSNGAFIAFQFGANGDKPTMTAFRY